MAMPLGGLLKPEYLLRPANIISRLRYRNTASLPACVTALVRGRPFRLNPHEVIGRHLLHFGLFDLLVTEALTRLADTGEIAVDVGANVGYMARVLADRVGPKGRVIAFEPHPEIFADLAWNTSGTPVEPVEAAASERAGTAQLRIPRAFANNRGIASLEATGDSVEEVAVPTVSLDTILSDIAKIGVMKIDIEGHELSALRGSEAMLREGRVRDIVFEEHDPANSMVAAHLIARDYQLFRLHKEFFGPRLLPLGAPVAQSHWESPSLLATLDPKRAQARFGPRGWQCLRGY
jgi:FkbM family methyltransferase